MPKKMLKRIGLALLLIPIIFLLVFLFGETAGGDVSGIIHLAQVAPLFALLFVSWKWPRVGGSILVSFGLVLGIFYASTAHFPIQTIILVESVLFLPPVVAGILLILSSRKQ